MRVGVDPGQVFRVWYSGWDELGILGLFCFNGPGLGHFVFKGLGLSLYAGLGPLFGLSWAAGWRLGSVPTRVFCIL
ncbi:hypothetical protein EUGRSUZ_B02041 [Eucalyptus grandis]|uniref:Uncharacterized protein n=2 Tax=Eucalyptus grandis TaxID=71139 RepID=A0ACC3LS47_EUCGR|nr:hypothetical protein EUGRSUZ_B02041 [Eucalyptus grandis]